MSRRAAPALVVALLATACAGERKTPTEEPGPTVPSATFQAVQFRILTQCTFAGCHATPTNQTDLDLEYFVAYENLVRVASKQYPAVLRVKPGDPDQSYLYWKLVGRQPVGARMPLNRPPIASEDIELLETWIRRGAPNN